MRGARVRRTHERVHLTRNWRECVMLLAAADLESIEATLEPLADPEARDRISRSRAEVSAGDVLDEAVVQVPGEIGRRVSYRVLVEIQVLDISHRRDAYR